MKAAIEYNLPEDAVEYERANNASKYYDTLYEFDQYMRNILKYGSREFKDKENATIEKLRKQFHELMQDKNIKFD